MRVEWNRMGLDGKRMELEGRQAGRQAGYTRQLANAEKKSEHADDVDGGADGRRQRV